jgi:hypothetical protein
MARRDAPSASDSISQPVDRIDDVAVDGEARRSKFVLLWASSRRSSSRSKRR